MNPNSIPAMIRAARTRRNLFRLVSARVHCPGCHQETLALTNNRRLCLDESCQVIWA
jgi:hypothetical protein